MKTREQLDRELAQAPDSLLEEVLSFLLSIKQGYTHKPLDIGDHDNKPSKQSILERMGGIPQYLLADGNLSDRDQRRTTIATKIRGGYLHQ